MINVSYEIERLISFGKKQGLIGKLDAVSARNQLLDIFGVKEPYNGDLPEEDLQYPTVILDRLVEAGAEAGLFDKEIPALRDLFDTKLMGCLMPRESEVEKTFFELLEKDSAKKATEYFYHISLVSNYIRTAQISRNISWKAPTEYGNIEITINLTKPEKDPKTIALEKLQPQSNYPKCLLCLENLGYTGRVNFPARQTLRVVPVTIAGEQWYLQYSPYVYYNEHCIVLSEKHEPMSITRDTFQGLFDFVKQFPHYICGSNADLPIVGGSILSHNHFQGGGYTFPMHRADIVDNFRHPGFDSISLSTLKWPLSVIRAASESIEDLVAFSDHILNQWRGYNDKDTDILAFTEDTPHNTVTPIARVNPEGKYEIDLVLRNNRTSEEFPDGIFHPHREIHHIKKENIGLIEVMGMAILPGRLRTETEEIKKILTGKLDIGIIEDEGNQLYKHKDWIKQLANFYGTKLEGEKADEVLRNEVGRKFATCLEHTGVFKQNPAGREAFGRFLASAGCKRV